MVVGARCSQRDFEGDNRLAGEKASIYKSCSSLETSRYRSWLHSTREGIGWEECCLLCLEKN